MSAHDVASPYSSHAAVEASGRVLKAEKIIAVLAGHVSLEDCRLLDIGTGSGHIARRLAERAASVTSVNVADERVVTEGYDFVEIEGHELPFADGTFDVVVSNQVIEHMPCQAEHLREMARVLRDDGVAYLATPNKYGLVEPHFGVPLLSWLPRRLADLYTRRLHGKSWDVYPLSASEVRCLVEPHFEAIDVTIDVLRDPKGHALDVSPALHALFARTPRAVYEAVHRLMPSYIWVLRKR